MTEFKFRKVAVLGAGVMGAQIAAHLINVRVPVVLFDLAAKEGDKSGIVSQAVERLKKLRPAPLAVVDEAALIQQANYDEHLPLLSECDLIIEAIAERMDWKIDLYERIAPHIAPHAIVASNTSGLSMNQLADVLPKAIRPRFCGVHFFNPPRAMHYLELIPTRETRADVMDTVETFATTVLGKGVVRAFDTPNFIGNRIGFAALLIGMVEADKFGFSPDLVDDLTGKKLARSGSATYRTMDVVGLDTAMHVIKTMDDQLPKDPFHAIYQLPSSMADLIAKGQLGQKSGAGYFKKVGRDILRYDAAKGDYVPGGLKASDVVSQILKMPASQRLDALRTSTDTQAKYLWAILRDIFHYSAVHLAEVAPCARDIDFAMRWGFGWKQGPFELWQEAGWQKVANWIKEDIDAKLTLCDAPLPAWVFDGRNGVHLPEGSWSAQSGSYLPQSALPVYQRQYFRENVLGGAALDPKKTGQTIYEDEAIRLWTLDEPVLIASLKTKVHALSRVAVHGLHKAIDEAENGGYQGLVIWAPDALFSAGFDLKTVMELCASQGAAAVEKDLADLQRLSLRLRYALVPTVAAVHGKALGGGCEIALYCARRVMALESAMGLVEFNVGVIPAGGGLTYLARRAAEKAGSGHGLGTEPFILPAFDQVMAAQTSGSALDAVKLGYALHSDIVVPHKDELLYVAIQQARAMSASGYRPPLQQPFPVGGTELQKVLQQRLQAWRQAEKCTEYDEVIGQSLARVLSGGDVAAGTVMTEADLIALERQEFIRLLGNEKTLQRIEGMLNTGKAVRN